MASSFESVRFLRQRTDKALPVIHQPCTQTYTLPQLYHFSGHLLSGKKDSLLFGEGRLRSGFQTSFLILPNYTDRATAVCRRSYCHFLRTKGVVWSAQRIPTSALSAFYAESSYYFVKVAPSMY
jgi:hypothetical protein